MGKAEEEAKKVNEQLKQTKQNVDSTKETMDELVFATRDFTDEANKAAKAVFDNKTQVAATTKAFRDLSKTAAATAVTFEEISSGAADISAATKLQIKYEKEKKKLAFELRQGLSADIASHLDMEKIMKGEETIAGQLKDQFSKMTPEQRKLVKIYHEQFKALKDQDSVMAEMSRNAKNIDKGMGLTGKAIGNAGEVLKKAGLSGIGDKMGLEKAVVEGRKLSAELTNGGKDAAGIGTKMKVAGKMIGTVGKSISAAFGPITLIAMALKEIISAVKKVDEAAGALAKELGTSYSNALALGGEFRDMADTYGDIYAQGEDIAKAQIQLNKHFKSSVVFTGALSAEMASIQKRTGLSGESMNYFAQLSLKSGKTIKSTLKDITKTTIQQQKGGKLLFSAKKIQEQIGKTSNLIRLNNKNSVEELAKAVIATNKLGLSMEKLDSIGGSLLDFESSIAAEMEAELLLGKDINLEKARAAALANDEVGLAEALAEQVGTAAEFGAMNRIQQNAIAKAMGLTRTEMADMLMEQENLNTLQNAFGDSVKDINGAQQAYNQMKKDGLSDDEIAAQIGDDNLARQLEANSKQEEFNAMIREVQEGFADIGMKVLEFYDGLTKSVGGAKNLLRIIGLIGAGYIAISLTAKLINKLNKKKAKDEQKILLTNIAQSLAQTVQTKQKQAGNKAATQGIAAETTKAAIMGTQAAAATTTNAMATFGIGTVIAVAAVAAALASLATYAFSSADDAIAPVGYGNQGLMDFEKGELTMFNNQDKGVFVAGTDLEGKNKSTPPLSSPQTPPQTITQDNSEIISVLSEQNTLLRAIVEKTTTIEMNSNEVGAELATSERAIQ